MKDLEHFLAVMRARYTSLQVRSDNKEALKHVWKLLHLILEVKIVSEP